MTDTGHGNDSGFRDGVTALELPDVAGIQAGLTHEIRRPSA